MAEDMLLFWGSGSPPCWKIMITLEEKSLQGYHNKLLSFEKKEHKSKEVMDINPRGQLPTFKHGNNVINESYGACLYLESQFKSQGTQLIPDIPSEQALVYQRMFEGQTLQQKQFLKMKATNEMEDVRIVNVLKMKATNEMEDVRIVNADVLYYTWRVPEAERHDSALKRNKEALMAELQLWEGYFSKPEAGPYLAGKAFTMADVVCFPVIAYGFRFGLSQEKYPKLGEYYTLVKERPSVKASWPPHWLENPQGMDTLKDV